MSLSMADLKGRFYDWRCLTECSMERKIPKLNGLKTFTSCLAFYLAALGTGCHEKEEAHRESTPQETGSLSYQRQTFYDINRIQKIEIWMSDWNKLATQQPKGGRCNFEFNGEHFDTFSAPLVKVNGQEYKDVALKKSSFCGSLSDSKPNLKVNFGKFNKLAKESALQNFGTGELILKNSVQDQSLLRQCLAAEIFKKAGFSEQYCNFIEVWANNQKIGLYVNLEPTDKAFFNRNFGDKLGNLYEVAGEELDTWALPRFRDRLDSFKDQEDTSLADMTRLVNVLKNDQSQDLASLDEVLDIEHFIKYWAMEMIIVHWDGLTNNINNSFIYFRPSDGKAMMLPRGMDQVLTDYVDPKNPSQYLHQKIYSMHSLASKLLARPVYAQKLKSTVDHYLATLWDERALLARIETLAAYPAAHVPEWSSEGEPRWSYDRLKKVVSNRKQDLAALWSLQFSP